MDKIASPEFKLAERIESCGIKEFLANSTKEINRLSSLNRPFLTNRDNFHNIHQHSSMMPFPLKNTSLLKNIWKGRTEEIF